MLLGSDKNYIRIIPFSLEDRGTFACDEMLVPDPGYPGYRQAKRFAFELLEREGVAATPAIDFGSNETKRYVRFAYTRSMADLEEAAVRLKKFSERKIRPQSAAAASAAAPGARARRAP